MLGQKNYYTKSKSNCFWQLQSAVTEVSPMMMTFPAISPPPSNNLPPIVEVLLLAISPLASCYYPLVSCYLSSYSQLVIFASCYFPSYSDILCCYLHTSLSLTACSLAFCFLLPSLQATSPPDSLSLLSPFHVSCSLSVII